MYSMSSVGRFPILDSTRRLLVLRCKMVLKVAAR
jgi:hypothetical protein